MAFPSTNVLDDFNRANEAPLSAAGMWTLYIDGSSSGDVQLTSNKVALSSTGPNNYGSAYTDAIYGADQEAFQTLDTLPGTGNFVSLVLRLQSTNIGTNNWGGYQFQAIDLGGGSMSFSIYRHLSGSVVQIGSTVNHAISAGDKIGATAIGSTLNFYVYHGGVWSIVVSVTNTDITGSGRLGFFLKQFTGRIDDFGGGASTVTFPTTSVLDNFNRANETPLSTAGMWTASIDGTAAPNLDTNRIAGVAAAFRSAYTDTSYGADQEAYATIPIVPTGAALVSLFLRLQSSNIGTSNFTGYQFQCVEDGTGKYTFGIYYQSGGSTTLKASMASVVLAAGDKIGAEAIGSQLTFYKFSGGSWSPVVTVSDSSISAGGFIGFEIQNAVTRLDDFGGGAVVGALTDSDTVRLNLTPSGVDVSSVIVDADTAKVALTPSAVETRVYDDSGTVVLLKVGSGTDAQVFADSVTAYLDLQPSGSEIGPFGDIATEYLDLVPSGVSIGPITDLATVPLRFTPAQEVVIADTIPLHLTPISTIEEMHQCLPRFVGEIQSWLAEDIRTNWHGELDNPRWSAELVVEAVMNHVC